MKKKDEMGAADSSQQPFYQPEAVWNCDFDIMRHQMDIQRLPRDQRARDPNRRPRPAVWFT
jgi:hypothetical protein